MEILFASSQLASTLRMDVHILPVAASLLTCPLPGSTAQPAQAEASGHAAGEALEAASRVPILEVTDISASATVQLIGCAFVGLPRSLILNVIADYMIAREGLIHVLIAL